MEAKKSPKADLENKRAYLLDLGLIISLTIMIIIFGWKTYDVNEVEITTVQRTGIIEDVIPITDQKVKPAVPPMITVTALHTVDNKTDVIDIGPIDVEIGQDIPIPTYTLPSRPEPEPQDLSDDIIIVPDVSPSFPGGEKAMFEYLHKQVKYTELAKSAGIEGTVYVTFVVERDGTITAIRLLRGIGGGLDQLVLQTIANMPKWKPGWQGGKLVRVQYNLPVKFELKDL
jgi:periplasmic protein TonB